MWALTESGGIIDTFDTYEEARAELDRKLQWESNFRYTHYYYSIEEVDDGKEKSNDI